MLKVNVTKLRREAHDSRYSHMVMEPTTVMWLCDEITKLRNKVIELGGDPYALDPTLDAPAPEVAVTPPPSASSDLGEALSAAAILAQAGLPTASEAEAASVQTGGGDTGGAGATADWDEPAPHLQDAGLKLPGPEEPAAPADAANGAGSDDSSSSDDKTD